MNKKLIALAQAGKVAVVNDGTVEELNKVLKKVFYQFWTVWRGVNKYYWLEANCWEYSDTAPSLPCHSVREFLQDEEEQDHGFKWGEGVRWENDEVIYVAKDPGDETFSIVLYDGTPIRASNNALFRITPKRRITRAEIKEKLGIEGEWEIVD